MAGKSMRIGSPKNPSGKSTATRGLKTHSNKKGSEKNVSGKTSGLPKRKRTVKETSTISTTSKAAAKSQASMKPKALGKAQTAASTRKSLKPKDLGKRTSGNVQLKEKGSLKEKTTKKRTMIVQPVLKTNKRKLEMAQPADKKVMGEGIAKRRGRPPKSSHAQQDPELFQETIRSEKFHLTPESEDEVFDEFAENIEGESETELGDFTDDLTDEFVGETFSEGLSREVNDDLTRDLSEELGPEKLFRDPESGLDDEDEENDFPRSW